MELIFSFSERPYSGNSFRPRPEIHIDAAANLLIVATPWGPRASARRAIDRMLEYFTLASSDGGVTSPFEKLTCLSMAANNLRTATLLANEILYREDNRNEYKTGVELFCASCSDQELIWLQLGQPQVMLARATGHHLIPLGGYVDLALDMSESATLLPALPNQLLGLDSTVNLTMNNFRAKGGDRVLLISHSAPPTSLYSQSFENMTLENISALLANAQPDTAFWIGLLEVQEKARESEMSA